MIARVLVTLAVLAAGAIARAQAPARTTGQEGIDLLADVRDIAERLSRVCGETIAPPTAVHAGATERDAVIARRAAALGPVARLRGCGRAWAEIGLGVGDGPERLVELVARDIDGVTFDPATRRVLVDPALLPSEDFLVDGPTDAGAQVLLATGVRPDEPRIAHVLMHVHALAATDAPPTVGTTDALLARAAAAEGEANLHAIRYLFRSMGMGEDVVRLGIDPGEVLEGALVPAALGRRSGSVDDLAQFVYREGFAVVAEVFARGGAEAVASFRRRAEHSRDVLHPERIGAATVRPDAGAAPEGMERVCTDTLGEQAVIVLVSRGTGKDNLGLIAGDGWAGDSLARWESPGNPSRARTVWVTSWTSAKDAADFAYAYRRVLEARFPGAIPEDSPSDRLTLVAGAVRWSLVRTDRTVEIRIDQAGD